MVFFLPGMLRSISAHRALTYRKELGSNQQDPGRYSSRSKISFQIANWFCTTLIHVHSRKFDSNFIHVPCMTSLTCGFPGFVRRFQLNFFWLLNLIIDVRVRDQPVLPEQSEVATPTLQSVREDPRFSTFVPQPLVSNVTTNFIRQFFRPVSCFDACLLLSYEKKCHVTNTWGQAPVWKNKRTIYFSGFELGSFVTLHVFGTIQLEEVTKTGPGKINL